MPTGQPFSLRDAHHPAMGGGFDLRQPQQRPTPSDDHPLARQSPAKATYSAKGKKGKASLEAVGHEMKEDEPGIVGATRRKKGAAAAARQKTAILLSKARKRGVKIPVD